MQLARGRAVFKFWPEKRGDEYLRRVARHIGPTRGPGAPLSAKHVPLASSGHTTAIPPQFYTLDVTEAVEMALFYGDVFLQEMHRQARKVPTTSSRASQETSNAGLGPISSSVQDENVFFDLFSQGIDDIVQARQSQVAFANLNAAFDLLKGLLVADHPIVYYRLAAILLSCRAYPDSEIARRVCRLLAVHLLQLGRIVMGPGHPINHWWSSGIKMLDSKQWDHADNFLQSAERLGSKYIAYVPGTVDLLTYAPSNMRGLKDEVLREKIKEIAEDMSRLSEAQEAKLCLSELLLGQGQIHEGLQILREAVVFRRLDHDRPASKAFWFSELFSRAGEIDDALQMLTEAIELADEIIGTERAEVSILPDEMLYSNPDQILLAKQKALEQGNRMFQSHSIHKNMKQ